LLCMSQLRSVHRAQRWAPRKGLDQIVLRRNVVTPPTVSDSVMPLFWFWAILLQFCQEVLDCLLRCLGDGLRAGRIGADVHHCGVRLRRADNASGGAV